MRVVSKMSGTEEKHVCNPRAVTLPLPADKAAAHHTLHVSSAHISFRFPDPTYSLGTKPSEKFAK